MATKKSSKRASAKKPTTKVTKHVSDKALEQEPKTADVEKHEAKTTTQAQDTVPATPATPKKKFNLFKKFHKENASKPKQSLTDSLADISPAAILAELLGTFVFSAAVLRLITNNNFGSIAIALIFAIIVLIFGKVSGGHFNPAITIAAWVNHKINGAKAFAYIVAQIVGAAIATLVISLLVSSTYDLGNEVAKLAINRHAATQADIDKEGGIENWAHKYIEKMHEQIPEGKTAVEVIAEGSGLDKNLGVGIDVSSNTHIFTQPQISAGNRGGALAAEILGSIVFGLGVGFVLFNGGKKQLANGLAMGISMLAGLVIAGSTSILNPALAITLGAYHWGNVAAVLWPMAIYILGPIIGITIGVAIAHLVGKSVDAEPTKA